MSMHGLFNRRGAVQGIFEEYKAHRELCLQAIRNGHKYHVGYFVDMQGKNNLMIDRFQTVIKNDSKKDWTFETPLRVQTALEQLAEFKQRFSKLINPTHKYQLIRNEPEFAVETSARMARATFGAARSTR